jgi:hypothetical protein
MNSENPVDRAWLAKRPPMRNRHHLRFVASLRFCMICGHPDVQAAHLPIGPRGRGMKSGDDFTVPLCAPRLDEEGCHARHDRATLSFWRDLKFDHMIEDFAHQLYRMSGNAEEALAHVKRAHTQIAARRFTGWRK